MDINIEFKKVLSECPVIAIVRGAGPDEILGIAEAITSPGIRLIEVTMNSPKALKAVVPAPILAVGGVDLDNVSDYLRIADGVGVGSGIYKKGKSLSDIESDSARYVAVVKSL